MEVDWLCTRFQSVLRSAEKSLGKKLVDFGREDSSSFENVLASLDEVLNDQEREISESDTRRIHFILFLNTDFSSIERINEEESTNIAPVLGTLPTLSRYLYFLITCHFRWERLIGEVITQVPEVLCIDLLKCVDLYFKSVKLERLAHFLAVLFRSLFNRVISFAGEESINKKYMFIKVFHQLLELPFKEMIKDAPNRELSHRYFGEVCTSLLSSLNVCIKGLKAPGRVQPIPVYELRIDFDYSQWTCVEKALHWGQRCLDWLIKKARQMCMMITVDDYLFWCEVDFEARDEKSLQSAFREAAYLCVESLKTLDPEEYPDAQLLIHVLNNFAQKPKTEEEVIAEASLETILKTIDDPTKSQSLWMRGLLEKDEVLDHIPFIRERKSLLDWSLVYFLATKVVKAEKDEAAINLVLNCVRELCLEDQMKLLKAFFITCGPTSGLQLDSFQADLNTALNKFNLEVESRTESFTEIVLVSLQNSRDLMKRLVDDSLGSGFKVEVTQSILKGVPPLAYAFDNDATLIETYVRSAVEKADTLNANEKENLILLVTKLGAEHFIDSSDLVLNCVIGQFECSLHRKNWDSVLFWLDFLTALSSECGFASSASPNPVVVLSSLVQLLNSCRLGPSQFTALTGAVCEKTVALILRVVEYLEEAKETEDSEILWLRGLSSKTSPLAWTHLTPIWRKWMRALPVDTKGVLRWKKHRFGFQDLTAVNSQERLHFVTGICKTLPLLTSQEWLQLGCDPELRESEDLVQSIEVFNILVDSLLVLTQIEAMTRKCIAALSYTAYNFYSFVKYCTTVDLRDKGSTAQVRAEVIKKVSLITVHLPREIVHARCAQILSALQDLISLASKDKETREEIQKSLGAINETSVSDGLSSALEKIKD